MDINEPSESEESNNSLHSLSFVSSSTIFQNAEYNNTTERGFFNRFMSFCETNILNNTSQYGNDITENTTSEENILEQHTNENMEKSINENDVTENTNNETNFTHNYLHENYVSEKIVTENDCTENPINESDFIENPLNESDFIENPLNENDFTEKPRNYDFIENIVNDNNFIKKLMTEDDFIDKFLEKTTEKNANANANPIKEDSFIDKFLEKTTEKNANSIKKFNKTNSNKKITNVSPKRAYVEKEKPKSAKTNKTKTKNEDEENVGLKVDQVCLECTNSAVPVAHIKLEVLDRLKLSTRKLIQLLEEIQLKTHSNLMRDLTTENQDLADIIRSLPTDAAVPSAVDIAVNRELKNLQQHTKSLDAIHIEDEKDDCSIYKRLTRKCVCMNRADYNDFMIHFNENSKFFTSNTGEIIKNVRILKKFLYIGGEYSKRAFRFLNEGLQTANRVEKIEIIHGCSHADVCNIFEEYSIVATAISWPCKSENFGDSLTQFLAASILLKMAQIEEGRRYLNYTSKISNDIKKVIRQKSSFLSFDVIESLNSILNLLQPPMVEHIGSVTYYCKAVEEGFGFKTVTALARYRQYFTLEEVFIHLDLIHNLSKTDCGKNELRKMLPEILSVFRNLLLEFDNSEMNIILTNILNNIIPRNILSQNSSNTLSKSKPIAVTMTGTTTDAIEMKNESAQIPTQRNIKYKNRPRSKSFFMTTNKYRENSRRKIWELPSTQVAFSTTLEQNTKVCRNPVIVVPINKQKKIFWI